MIKINKETNIKILSTIPEPFIFNHEEYKIDKNLTGKNVKLAIIDSGFPIHRSIKNPVEKISFCDNDDKIEDNFGHSSMITGIIVSNNKKSIKGIAPNTKLYFAKTVNYNGECNFNSLVAAILWAVVKKVNIILLSLGSQVDYPLLHDAIKKAYESKICIITASGNNTKNKNIDFPARYEETLSVANITKNVNYNKIIKKEADIIMRENSFYTTYLNDTYIKASGSSMSAAFVAGITSLIIEKYIKEKKRIIPKNIYNILKKIKFN